MVGRVVGSRSRLTVNVLHEVAPAYWLSVVSVARSLELPRHHWLAEQSWNADPTRLLDSVDVQGVWGVLIAVDG